MMSPAKSFTATWLLSLTLGIFGADRFYLGKTGSGVAKLLTLGGVGIWYLVDLIIILTGGARDSRGFPLTDEPSDKKKQWIISAAVIAFLLVVGTINNAGATEVPVVGESAAIAEPTETPEPIETPAQIAATPEAVNPDSAENKSIFIASANRDLSDMNKDLDDMVMRANNAQMFRLIGNAAEISFNLGQLGGLTAPSGVSVSWEAALASASATHDALTTTAGNYASSTTDLGTILGGIDGMRAQLANLAVVVSQVG
jgi:TM2 domain-containing membrane protein YozV